MPLYTYRAVNEDGQEVRGTIESPDIESARSALEHDIHLDPVEIQEAMRMRRPGESQPDTFSSLTVFIFEGMDTDGVARKGTIQAESKRKAFERLHNDQKLTLSVLKALNTPTLYEDAELMEWQKKPAENARKPGYMASENTVANPPDATPFTNLNIAVNPLLETAAGPAEKMTDSSLQMPSPASARLPLSATLRLYFGWLLAWYGLLVGIGYFSQVRKLPWDVSLIEAFSTSSLIFSFIIAIFLYLMLTSLHQRLHGRVASGILLGSIGIAAFVFLRATLA